MASEKFRYFPKTDTETEKVLEEIEARYREFIQHMPSRELRKIMSNISTGHSHIGKEVVSRNILLTKKEMGILLNSVIDAEAGDDDIINPEGEMAVEQITSAMIENAAELIQKNELIQAALIGCVIISVIESRMGKVYDEGWTFQGIIKDGFELLHRISRQTITNDMREELVAECTVAFNSRDDDNRYYDNEWKEVINALTKNV